MRFQQSYQIGNSTLSIKFGDIRDATTEVIVTSDDSQLSMGGGTSKAIREAAGESVYEASREFLPVILGQIVSTSAGNLKQRGVRQIFHSATIPSAAERKVENQDAIVRSITQQALEMLRAMKLKSIALPALGAGHADFEVRTVAVAMSEVIRALLETSPEALNVEIWLLMGTRKDLDAVMFLSEFTERAQLQSSAVRSHAVALLHGIRTAAGWRERIGDELEQGHPELTPVPIGYGFFDIVRFLLPITALRRNAAETVWGKMEGLFKNPNIDRVSIVAHSFGTWIVGHLLATKDLRFHRVILCGAILDTNYNWDQATRKIDQPNFQNAPTVWVVNDCGTKDVWPIFAKFATWGYGASGRWGFQHGSVRDRFHAKAHSGFFESGFASKYWVPALTGIRLTEGIKDDISPPWWLAALTVVKLPYALIAVGLLIWFAK